MACWGPAPSKYHRGSARIAAAGAPPSETIRVTHDPKGQPFVVPPEVEVTSVDVEHWYGTGTPQQISLSLNVETWEIVINIDDTLDVLN